MNTARPIVAGGTGATTAAAAFAALSIAPTQTIYVTGSGTYTTPSGAKTLLVELIGGGGGGGGVNGQGTDTTALGGDAGSGAYCRLLITSPAASYTYAVGSGGAGGTAGANNGSAGGDTTFTDGGSIDMTAAGGTGGTGHTGIATSGTGGTPGSGGAATGGDGLSVAGSDGGLRRILSGISGSFPSVTPSRFGYSRTVPSSASNGVSGLGPGDGGAGAMSYNVATDYAGGSGKAGCILITECY